MEDFVESHVCKVLLRILYQVPCYTYFQVLVYNTDEYNIFELQAGRPGGLVVALECY